MQMKYFQGIADILNHYNTMMDNFQENRKYGLELLETWNVYPEDKDDIFEEREALRYLLGCRLGMVREKNAQKPSLEVVERCFQRHVAFMKEIHGVDDYNVNKHDDPLVKKEFKTCRHYLFKFSLPAWYEKLPEEILTFENKYPDYHRNR